MDRRMSLAVMLLVGLTVIGACTSQQPPTGNAVRDIPEFSDEDPSTDVQDVSLEIGIGTFTPSQITIRQGVPVRLSITAAEIDPQFSAHGFAVKELDINENIPLGETKIVEFTPDRTGSFVFFCSVYCGEGHVGQTGIMHVVE